MIDSRLLLVLKAAVAPYIVGLLLSPKVLPVSYFQTSSTSTSDNANARKAAADKDERASSSEDSAPPTDEEMMKQFENEIWFLEQGDPFEGIRFAIHRNGEVEPCGKSGSTAGILDAFRESVLALGHETDTGPADFDKYFVDSFLTGALAFSLLDNHDCGPYQDWEGRSWWFQSREEGDEPPSLLGLCDMDEDYTVIQLDHDELVDVSGDDGILPCHFHTREGVRVTSLSQLAELARETKADGGTRSPGEDGSTENACVESEQDTTRVLHLYAVPAGRIFMFAPSYVGEIIELPHVAVKSGLPVSLEVMSLSPRVFDIKNFFDREESKAIVDKALHETSDTHRIKRSSTGASGYNVNSQRTSENGFDTHGKEALIVKRRCFDVLGFDEFIDSMADGLQVLRYNQTTAYIPHLDWIDDKNRNQEHNFDSAGVGSNRFATILLYMSDLGEGDGGETVFTEGWPVGQTEDEHVSLAKALQELRESDDANMLAKGSWEEKMVAQCRSRLAIRPNSARAVLFYSQHPWGAPDSASMHGGCPVLSETPKWAANLWVWNAPRGGYPGSPKNLDVVEQNKKKGVVDDDGRKSAKFMNSGSDERTRNAELYFQEKFWDKIGFGDPPISVNTYEGHKWNVRVNGERIVEFTIDERKQQTFTI